MSTCHPRCTTRLPLAGLHRDGGARTPRNTTKGASGSEVQQRGATDLHALRAGLRSEWMSQPRRVEWAGALRKRGGRALSVPRIVSPVRGSERPSRRKPTTKCVLQVSSSDNPSLGLVWNTIIQPSGSIVTRFGGRVLDEGLGHPLESSRAHP